MVGLLTRKIVSDTAGQDKHQATVAGAIAAIVFLSFFSTYRYGRPYLTSAPETFWLCGVFLALAWSPPKLLASRFKFPLLAGLAIGVGCLYKSFAMVVPVGLGLALCYQVLHARRAPWQVFRPGMVQDSIKVLAICAIAVGVFSLWFALDPLPGEVWREFVVGENAGKFKSSDSYLKLAFSGSGGILVILTVYFVNAGLLLPLAVGAAWTAWRSYRSGQAVGDAEKVMWLWLLALAIVFMLPSQRSARYLIAAMPAVAVLMAIPTAERDLVRLVEQLSREAGLPMFVLPEVRDLFTAPAVADIRPVTEADLLGRELAEIDTAAVAHYITDRRVLVTGAGGSIGSELCRQLARFEPEALIMLDRDESGLHGTQLSIEGRALLNSPNLVLADIRDEARLQEVFLQHRPHVVFHAAALKHLPLLEGAPDEAWKTNVLGTQHVLAAAQAAGVDHFVNISTDKAADPVSVLGSSKRITERLTSHMADHASGAYVSVRFGNVLGSRGSVLTIFREQVEQGGPLTVTHEDVTRFFMTVQEAVRLTIYAGAIGESGDVMVLDMGEP
eukprot:gene16073-33762_t